jgi:hypothetical protein
LVATCKKKGTYNLGQVNFPLGARAHRGRTALPPSFEKPGSVVNPFLEGFRNK